MSFVITPNDPRKLHESLLMVVHLSKKSFVTIGKILYELRLGDKFKSAVGAGADTWPDYLKQPEIGLSVGEASRLIQIYEELILRLDYDEDTIAEIPVKNAHYLLPLVKGIEREEADELVVEATLMSQKDFKSKVYEARMEKQGKKPVLTYQYLVMRKAKETGNLERVHDVTNDQIKKAFDLHE